MENIKFDMTDDEARLIQKIVTRALNNSYITGGEIIALEMDLAACNANGTPLDFEKLLAFDAFNFAHDIGGIRRHLDRDTGKLKDCFTPRCVRRSAP